MTAIVHVISETPPIYIGVAETPDVCKGITDMLSVCIGVTEMSPDHNRVAGNPKFEQKKQSGLMTTSENIPLRS